MAKVSKCWAACLDDCSGKLSREHLIPVCLWESSDPGATRETRLRVPVRAGGSALGGIPAGDYTAGNIQAKVLCKGHNTATSILDLEGQKLAKALQLFWGMNIFAGTPIAIPPHQFDIDGPLLERFLLKLAINFCVSARNKLPIGSPNAPAGYPTEELVEMVFGRRLVIRPRGLWGYPITAHHIMVPDEFHVTPVIEGGYFVGGLIEFRRLHLVINFEEAALNPFPDATGPDRHPFNGLVPFQPVNQFVSASGTMKIAFHWPPAAPSAAAATL